MVRLMSMGGLERMKVLMRSGWKRDNESFIPLPEKTLKYEKIKIHRCPVLRYPFPLPHQPSRHPPPPFS